MPERKVPRPVLIAGAVLAVGLCALTVHAAVDFPAGADKLFDVWLYNALILGGGILCLARGIVVRQERLAWLVLGVSMLCWSGGDLLWSLHFQYQEAPPYPSLSDALWLVFYPAAYFTLMLLVRQRVAGITGSMWLDGAIGALAAAALGAAAAFEPIVQGTSGEAAVVATNLAYPLGDLVLLGLVIGVFGLTSWRPGRAWVLIGIGMLVMAAADSTYLVQVAEGTYVEGGLVDVLWPTASLLIGAAAWQRAPQHARADFTGLRVVLVPAICALFALGLLAYQNLDHLSNVSVALALVTLVLVVLRMALSFRENQAMLRHSQLEASTDSLTGLNNRRKLMQDLDSELPLATPEYPRALVLFDLDGFKQYNDSYGHPAGDALLARLGRRLGEVTAPYGSAYRLGGDEFCVLVSPEPTGLDIITAATAAALSEHGEGFSVTSSQGAVVVPRETTQASEALQLADRRMYAEKGGRRSSASRQTRDVLLSTLRESQPQLHLHLHDVAELALSVGRALGLDPETLDELGRAAELHDVGKVAIPDAILNKPGPLDDEEWAFMRRHTIIGERILGAAPALRPVASIVRSSHERWDGSGYPDQLSGDEIPLGSRIVAVCDAYDAMTSERPYRPPLTQDEAVAELERCAGSQFDPAVIEVFSSVVEPAPTPA